MKEPKTWEMLIKHFAGEDSEEEKDKLSNWLAQSESNKTLYNHVKALWDGQRISVSEIPSSFFGRFTLQKMKDFIVKQAIGNLVGFVIGMWVTTMFSHYTLERRGLKNLFGLAGRKKVAVNDIPEWEQNVIAVLMGFITLELINHFFQTQKHIMIWRFLKRTYISLKNK